MVDICTFDVEMHILYIGFMARSRRKVMRKVEKLWLWMIGRRRVLVCSFFLVFLFSLLKYTKLLLRLRLFARRCRCRRARRGTRYINSYTAISRCRNGRRPSAPCAFFFSRTKSIPHTRILCAVAYFRSYNQARSG